MPSARTVERTTAGKSFPRPDPRFSLPPMKIAVDAMGGDHAPAEVVRGAVHASREFHLPIVLVGREERTGEGWGRGGGGGVARRAIAATIPTPTGPIVLIDAGANVGCKPVHLAQFGCMGEAYARKILGIPRPRGGIVSIGEEETKGTDLTRETAALFRKTGLCFVGNGEGRDFFAGKADVFVCAGFGGK